MADVCIIDTTVLLNLLNVPSKNDDAEQVAEDFATYAKANCRFIIPLVVAIETGNHISQNGDGNVRRQTAQRFFDMMKQSFVGELPFEISDFDLKEEWQNWLSDFPYRAMQNKTADKPNEGMSLADLSIIKEYEDIQAKNKANKSRKKDKVFIWSLDSDLSAYGG